MHERGPCFNHGEVHVSEPLPLACVWVWGGGKGGGYAREGRWLLWLASVQGAATPLGTPRHFCFER